MLARARSRGFTLVELSITLAIVGIVLMLGTPSITEWIQNSQIRKAAESVQNGLQTARTEAIRRNRNIEFVLSNPGSVGGTGWTVRTAWDENVVQSTPDGEGSRNIVLEASPDDAVITTFNGFGRLTGNADESPMMTSIAIDNDHLTDAQSRNLKVEVNAGGEIRMCDPNVTDDLDPRKCKT